MRNEVDLIKVSHKEIENKIFHFRGMQVMIDRDIAELYEVETKRLNEQVKRNLLRFPVSFCFQLSENEKSELVANCDRFKNMKHSTSLPYAFTEQGIAMLSAVLKSNIAIEMSIRIIEAFVEMKKYLNNNQGLIQRIVNIEKNQLITDDKINQIFNAMRTNELIPKQGIFYNGQIFDAFKFTSDIIRSAKYSIILIDNYIDDSVLTMLSKKSKDVKVRILTSKVSKQLLLDIDKFNQQYNNLTVETFNKSHDRFVIIDDSAVYHIGASLKDLGKKWFAFSKLDINTFSLIEKLT